MTGRRHTLLATAATMLLASSLLIGCGGAAPAPTSAPAPAAKPAATTAPAAPAPTAAAAPAPTKAAAPAPTKAPAAPARAEGFFKDKTINIILPNSAGRGNDTVLRYVVPYIEKAASAKMMVENLPGAGGMLGFNKWYTSKADGLNWGSGNPASMILQQMSGQEGVAFDVTKVNFLGRIYKDPRLMLTPAKGGVKTVDEALKLGRPLNLPIQGLDEDNTSMATLITLLGLKGKLITGYQGEADVFLACLRGEGDWTMSGATSAGPMIKDGDFVPVLALSPERLKDYPNVPTALEVLKDASAKDSVTAVLNILELLLSVSMPPGVDPKVVAEGRFVVDKAFTDPQMVAEFSAKTGGRQQAYMKGEELQSRVNQVWAQKDKLTPILKEVMASVK